ncbi:MAG: hypothetical protein AAF253_06830 [Pseudomonadota bacterium]
MKPKTVDSYFEKLEPPVAAIAAALRARLDALGGGPGEPLSVALAWGFPCWSGNKPIASIIAHSNRCNLQLFGGARLAGQFPEIEGTGKQLRHVKVHTVAAVDDRLDAILRAAIELDRTAPEKVR